MAIYLAVLARPKEGFEAKVAEMFPDNFFALNPLTFAVSAAGLTAKQVSEKLDITRGNEGGTFFPAVILPITRGHFGRFDPDLWQWLNVKSEIRNG